MELQDQIERFRVFFEKNYYPQLLEQAQTGKAFFAADFDTLSRFDSELADSLLDDPEEVIRAAELSIENFDILGNIVERFRIRFKNLPASQEMDIRNIRSEHIGKFFTFEGIVRQKSDVRPQVKTARFECPACGNVLSVIQLDTRFKEPIRCNCGRKGHFRMISKDLVDAQGIVLEEAPENLEGGEQPKRINIFLKNDLVSPITEKKTNPGSKVVVNGIVKEIPIILRSGGQSTTFDLLVEANYIAGVQEDFGDIEITKEEEAEIKELSQDPRIYHRLVKSIAPSIYGHDRIKEALLYQLMGGVRKKRDDGVVTRGDIHVLLIGDPGSGKSQLLKRVHRIAPKGRFVSGKGASGAGLTAAVVKDEFLKGWSLEAGALVLAHKGLCAIDELDKMSAQDRDAMHEALEGQTITISKANIQATLRAETTVLAAANPKFGRFDLVEPVAKQIDLPPTLINRFDLIFPVKDLPNKETDEKMAQFILTLHQNPNMENPEIGSEMLRKYIAYARQHFSPILTDSALQEIKEYYLKMRGTSSREGEIRRIPISPRQLEALVRLSEASAKVRLSNRVTKKDAKRAVDLLHHCLSQIGIDPETGEMDIDRITTGISATERGKLINIREIIVDLEHSMGKNIPVDDVVRAAAEMGMSEDKVEEALEKLKRSGDIFEPKRGFISRL